MKEVRVKIHRWCNANNMTAVLSKDGVRYVSGRGIPEGYTPWGTIRGAAATEDVFRSFLNIGKLHGWV